MSKHPKLNTIRIIGGKWRGRRLGVPKVEGLRPTIDRVRETLFNWLMHDIIDARCLDLFAGTGALGLESLSRGAEFVQFVESDMGASRELKSNVLALQIDGSQTDVLRQEALSFLSKSTDQRYDVVFLDPPFQSDLLAQCIELLVNNNWLVDKAMIYIELSAKRPFDDLLSNVPESWTLHRQGVAGESAYCLYIS